MIIVTNPEAVAAKHGHPEGMRTREAFANWKDANANAFADWLVLNPDATDEEIAIKQDALKAEEEAKQAELGRRLELTAWPDSLPYPSQADIDQWEAEYVPPTDAQRVEQTMQNDPLQRAKIQREARQRNMTPREVMDEIMADV